MCCLLCKASITTPPNAEEKDDDKASSPKPPPGRAGVEKEKPPSEPKAKSHKVPDEKLMARGRLKAKSQEVSDENVIVHSKRVGAFAPTEAATKAGPKDVDAAGDVSRSEDGDAGDADGQGSDNKGPGSDTADADDQGSDNDAGEDDFEHNACEPESTSREEDDFGEDEDHQAAAAEGNMNASDAQLDADITAAEESTKATDDPESARLLRHYRTIAGVEDTESTTDMNTDKLEFEDTPELTKLRLQPRRHPARNSQKMPRYKESSSSVDDKDVDTKGTISLNVIYISTLHFKFNLHFKFTFQIYISNLHFKFTFQIHNPLVPLACTSLSPSFLAMQRSDRRRRSNPPQNKPPAKATMPPENASHPLRTRHLPLKTRVGRPQTYFQTHGCLTS